MVLCLPKKITLSLSNPSPLFGVESRYASPFTSSSEITSFPEPSQNSRAANPSLACLYHQTKPMPSEPTYFCLTSPAIQRTAWNLIHSGDFSHRKYAFLFVQSALRGSSSRSKFHSSLAVMSLISCQAKLQYRYQ